MRGDATYLRHIAESIALAEQYIAGPGGEADSRSLSADQRTQGAVLRRLETLSDAANRLSSAQKARHPTIPWRQVADFRNVLAHAYTLVRLDQVWQAIVGDLPRLKQVVEAESRRIERDHRSG